MEAHVDTLAVSAMSLEQLTDNQSGMHPYSCRWSLATSSSLIPGMLDAGLCTHVGPL
jgi:hypothetical protein